LFSTIIGIASWLTVATACAMEPAAYTYTYRTLDNTGLQAINKSGELLVGPGSPTLLDEKLNPTQLRCPVLPGQDNTGAIRLNNRGDVVGWCSIYSRDLGFPLLSLLFGIKGTTSLISIFPIFVVMFARPWAMGSAMTVRL